MFIIQGSRPRMYGLPPKTHKVGIPLRPILAMTNSVQHQLAKWLTTLIQPVLEFYSAHCLKDSFIFAEHMRSRVMDCDNFIMCSFDVSSLFTNVPLEETIEICANKLYEINGSVLKLSKENFIKLMRKATDSVEFSFDSTIFRQVDGVAMGSPLGPSLANIFVGYQEQRLFQMIPTPTAYFRYVDDTFVILRNEEERASFHQILNNLHPNLQFTCETETDQKLPFLDVLVEKSGRTFTTSVYRKPTFTGQYIRWNSFCDKRRKTNLIKTLVHRAKRICSTDKLQFELEFITSMLMKNGYPERLVNKVTKDKMNEPCDKQPTPDSNDRSTVYLRLPYVGPVSTVYRQRVIDAVSRSYDNVNPRVILRSQPILSAAHKDVLPTLQRSNVIYLFTCHCDSRYVGKTTQRLLTRVKQHVPLYVRNNTKLDVTPQSAIGKHLRNNEACRQNFTNDCFTIIGQGRSEFHLSVLEALHIMDKRPNLCVQKRFVYSTILF